ncbi:hypothetical protein ICM_05606 [Bacillus cereus BAG1X2-3]|uniref:Uncharacterized protein n=1 Tax=Bacillus cereus TaxID=1396 RepID=A0A9X7E258_BACCE|nr:hypothetical protein [Bacillus cereus]EOO23417.1 hypothetical protein ICC_06028 [Bacillus cereus BAG1X1-1]EOO42959.1 hypothetical protein ICI_06186 [Bacillus cereus BAG1X2-1]EOO56582.1 hypothetical protein ICM_05606 [Bacillus cereus BAG1X2-3]EOP00211.1 hypothetical protein ICO_06461 [Bacillus cereus BAG2O-1]PHA19614.1 hypothetical protein COE70_18215 [Bacillus cereus]
MNKKKILSSVLSLGLAFGVGVATLALPVTPASADIGNYDGPIYIKDNVIKGVGQYEFNVPAGYGHVKCTFYNAGQGKVRIILKHADTDKVYIDKELEKGGSWDWKSNEQVSQGVRGGLYKLEIRSGELPTNVKFSFKAADTKW